MKLLLFSILVLCLTSCGEPPVREMTYPEKADGFNRDLESWHMLSETSITAARKINISAK